MTDAENEQFEVQVRELGAKGYPEQIKRKSVAYHDGGIGLTSAMYRLAEKKLPKRITEMTERLWKEMGVVAVMFTAYTTQEGRLIVDM